MLQIVVIAHGQGIAAFNRHRKYWEALNSPILVIEPENDPVETDLPKLTSAGAEHNGKQSILRLREMFETLNAMSWYNCLIYEYDSFSLRPEIPKGRGFYGNVFANAESPKFMAPTYANPPWFVDRKSFESMREVAITFPLFENGEADRWLSALAWLARVPIMNYEPKGFSRGLIDEDNITSCRDAIHLGACHIHGVKQEWVLAAINQFHGERK